MAYIRQVLTDTTHNGFPIVRGSGEAPIPALAPRASSSSADGESVRGGPMEGLILRSQLLVLLESKVTLLPGECRSLTPKPSLSQKFMRAPSEEFFTGGVLQVRSRGADLVGVIAQV